ncbi:MAG TPA: hypothetical protein PKY50_06135 [Candidatus Competibacter sp.]|nr:hypothetical protein [Candidatus Competibacter sp.]
MKKALFSLPLLAVLSAPALADTYQVTFGWTDPTAYLPTDAPVYEAKYRVNGGAETAITGLATPGGSVAVTANPGQTIEVAAQACNLDLCSPWTAWVAATASHPATQPAGQNSLTITVVRAGL